MQSVADNKTKARSILEAPVAQSRAGDFVSSTGLAIPPLFSQITISAPVVASHKRTMQLVQQHHLPVRYVGLAPAYKGVQLYQGANTEVVMMNLSEDPLYYENGGRSVMPKVVIGELQRILNHGCDFEAVYVAHEVPKGSVQPGEPVPLEVIVPPPPPRMRKRLSHLEGLMATYWGGVRTAIRLASGGALVAGAALIAAPAALVMATASLDPILFGLHVDWEHEVEGMPVALWYYLTSWVWPSE